MDEVKDFLGILGNLGILDNLDNLERKKLFSLLFHVFQIILCHSLNQFFEAGLAGIPA